MTSVTLLRGWVAKSHVLLDTKHPVSTGGLKIEVNE